MLRFDAPTDRTLRLLTALAVAVMIAIPAAVLRASWGDLAQGAGWPVIGLLLALPLAVPLLWALAPRRFTVEAGALRVERPLLPVTVPLGAIRGVEVLGAGALRGALRTFGVAGAFGHHGRYWSRSLGAFKLYARRSCGPFVLVDTAAERLLLAPSDAEGLAAALRERAPHLAPGDGAIRRAPPRRRRAWAGLAAAIALPLVLVAGVFAAVTACSPVAIDLDGDAIRIARRHAPAVEVPLDRVTDVAPLGAGELRGLRRVAGTALGDVGYGTFRSDALGRFQLYAYRRGGYVRVELPDGRLVLTPDDPDRFVAEVRARLAAR